MRRILLSATASVAIIAMGLFVALQFPQPAAAQLAAAGDPPLNFGNNFFVTGDYVVGGAYGLNTNFANDGTSKGTITIPDGNPGITGAKSVPTGAQIVAALLYWQTVEKVGQPGSGQNGFFRAVFGGGPATGYPITGVPLNSHATVSYSFGGCTGTSTGKMLQTYRADVRAFLPQDANGNVVANGTYEVRLPSVGPNTPLTLGATLVFIYRVLDPNVPLNSIVIYDGAFAPNNSTSLVMTQTMQGFYDAAESPVSRLTHIVGGGKSNKFQTVYLNNVALPNMYATGQPFPGYYNGSTAYGWDNTTWTFGPNSNPVHDDDASATTKVVPSASNQGCVSWGAIIFSTTVQNTDKDGILDVWKVPAAPNASTPGYCDASVNEGKCNGPGDPAWVDLPGAALHQQDVFVQLDYMCSSPSGVDKCTTGNGTDYSFDPRLTGADVMMTNAFSAHGIHLHINPVNPMGTTQPIHAIQEQTCTDNSINPICSSVATNGLTPFPGQPGVVGWKAGLEFFKSQPLNYPDEISCDQALNGPCIRRFQNGRKDSYHYALFAHAIGRTNWGLQGGSLASVVALHNTVTFTTSAPHGLVVDPHLGNGRVTIADAITNPNLNGTYLVQSVSPPAAVLAITQTSMSALGFATYKFTQVSGPAPAVNDLVTVQNTTNGNAVFNVGNATIASVSGSTFTVNFNVNGFVPKAIPAQNETGGCAPAVPTGACAHTNRPPFSFSINITTPVSPQTSYTELTDPNLTVTSGQATTGSGFSDIGGADTLVTLGLWGNPAFNGSSPATSPVSDGQKETVQAGTFMHELGHTLGLTHGGLFFDNRAQNPQDYTPTFDANCKSNYQSVMNYMFQSDLLGTNSDVLDFSSQQLKTLNETLLLSIATTDGSAVAFPTTTWYDLTPNLVGSKAKHHCDGSPMFFNANVPPFSADFTPIMYPHLNQALPSPWPANSLDINFDGMIDTGPHGYRGYNDWANIDLRQIGATGSDTAGGGHLGGGPGHLGGGPGKEEEIDFDTANGVTRPPRNLMASEDVSPRFIHLSWKAPSFGQIGAYRIYRSADGGVTFALIATVPGSQITYRDGVTTPPLCNPIGYQYFVTAVLAGTFAAFPPGPTEGQESEPSNTVSTGQNGGLLTACYAPAGFLLLSPPNPVIQGGIVSVTFTVLDDFNATNSPVNTTDNQALVTLVANGPLPGNCGTVGPTTLLNNGQLTEQSGAASAFPASGGGNYTFNWDTDGFCAGQYTLKLILDSTQNQTTLVQLQIDVTDTDSTPHVTTTAIPNGVVGTSYTTTISEHGGVTGLNPFTWTLANGSNLLPAGLSLGTAQDRVSGLLSGIPSAAGMFSFTVQVTDSAGNIGTQTLTMTVTTPVAQINQALVPDSSAPGGAGFAALTLNGTGFGPGSVVQWNGTPLVTTFISNRQLTAAIPAADVAALGTASVSVSNPVTVGNKAVPNSNIDFFQISPTTSASLSRTDYPTGMNPSGLIASDFNGDRKIDLATANSADGTVSILLGNGDGTFTAQPPLAIGAGSAPNSLTAGDFNADGILDLAVANFSANNVSIFLGNGDGTFKAPVTYSVANGPFFVITGDFNRDGILDLAVANQNGQSASILLGNGDGTFQAHVDYAAGGTAAATVAAVALGDFDRDGKLDLAVTNPANDTVSVLRGNGDGTFQAPVAYSTGNAGDQPLAVSAVDLRGTGILDLAVTNVNAKTVAILLGNGDGTFQPRVTYSTTSSASMGPGAIITGDFNADGKVDLAITNESANTVSILLGNGDGTLQKPLESTTGTFAAGVAAGDFNGDGRLDLAVADLQANTVSVMLQRPEPATNLAVSGATASQVSLTWAASASTTVIGYNVYRGTTSGGPYTKVNQAIVLAPTFTDMTVGSATTYFYVVRAVDPNNLESVNSNEVSVTTPPPPPPANLNAVVQGTAPNETVLLTWNPSASNNVASYNVYRATAQAGPFNNLIGSVTTNLANPSFTDATVSSGTTYYYVVTAVANNVEGTASNVVQAVVP